MQATSLLFFGLILVPLIIFLVWAFKQDKKRNLLGVVLLVIGVLIAVYTILRLDSAFVKENNLNPPTQQPKP
jgi:uncharacterized membrane protein YidH (DUF202 family)